MDSSAYLAASCAVALLGALTPLIKKQWRLALLIATAGLIAVMFIPIVVGWTIGLNTPGVGMVWFYTLPIAAVYAVGANAIALFRPRR